jgi:hypothetical protein
MNSVVTQLENWWIGLGVLSGVTLFVLGIFADETLRGVYHWLFDRRITHFWRVIKLRAVTDIPLEVRQTFVLRVPDRISEETDVLTSLRDTVGRGLWTEFDQIEPRGHSILEARSKRSPDFLVRLDIVLHPGQVLRANVTATVSSKVPYPGISDGITQSIVEIAKVEHDLTGACGGMAPTPESRGVTLTVRISKPPDILETLRQFSISSFEGRSDGLSVDFARDHATFVGEPGRELARAVRDVVTWYY